VRIRKVIACVGLAIGLSGAGVVAAAPQLVIGAATAAGVPGPCGTDVCE
jgi:hypothetical protein